MGGICGKEHSAKPSAVMVADNAQAERSNQNEVKPVIEATATATESKTHAVGSERKDHAAETKHEAADNKNQDTQVSEGKVLELSAHSRKLLSNVAGFLENRAAVNETAERVLPNKWMELHPSFMDAESMFQKNPDGVRARSLQEVLGVAKLAVPVFQDIMRNIVNDADLKPDAEILYNDKPLMLDHDTPFKVLSIAPLKGQVRCVEKVTKEYDGDYSKLTDVVRCSVVVYTEEQLDAVARALAPTEPHPNYKVVRLKNRFKTPLFNGYRDALYNIAVNCGNGVVHVCEVQLHLAAIVAHKEKNHGYYEYFRSYFSGSGSEEKLMVAMERIRGYGADVDKMLMTVLTGRDLLQLHALRVLVGPVLLGDVRLEQLVCQRLVEVDEKFPLQAKMYYASALKRGGKLEQAEPLYREVLLATRQQFGDAHADTLDAITNLASLLYHRGKMVEAEPLHREVLSTRRRMLGDTHADTLKSVNELALVLRDQRNLAEAEALLREAVSGLRQLLGDSNPLTLTSITNLTLVLITQGKLTEAEPLSREAVAGFRQQLGDAHPRTLRAIQNLGGLLKTQDKLAEAEPLYLEALSGFRQQLGETHPDTLNSLHVFAALLKAQGKLAEAEPLYREALAGRRQQLGASHRDTLSSIHHLASLLQAQGRFAEAQPLFREALTGRRQHLGNGHPDTLTTIHQLAVLLQAQGKLAEAEPLYQEAVAGRKLHLGDGHPDTLQSVNGLAELQAILAKKE